MTISKQNKEEEPSTCYCFFCAMKQPNPHLHRSSLSAFFAQIPYREHEQGVLVMSSLWSLAMAQPNDPTLPSLGALRCMSLLISKSLSNPSWLRKHQNIYIPYYAAHVIGSYTITLPSLASLAVESGALLPLLSLLSGCLTWVEQCVAIRALGHLASYDATFPSIARHADEIIQLAIKISSTCITTVYNEFICASKWKKYHKDLLTRGLGGVAMEDIKAEEWASQLQCWSLYLLSCFAWRDKMYHSLICRDFSYFKKVSRMWGGMANGDSPAGVGLTRILCRSEVGREKMAGNLDIVESLCNLSRSSDDWQYMGIDCLLLLVNDKKTRQTVKGITEPCLVDLAELDSLGSRKKLGDSITKALLLDFDENCTDERIKDLYQLKVDRKMKEERMLEVEIEKRNTMAEIRKQRGNEKFWLGEIEKAIVHYTEALELCPLNKRKERMVLYSNRAQCRLLTREEDEAISDSTRALSISKPANLHGKSLWRRAQAYDVKGMAKESLMDCIMFINRKFDGRKGKEKVNYYVARMINKQMTAAGLFAEAATVRNNRVMAKSSTLIQAWGYQLLKKKMMMEVMLLASFYMLGFRFQS